MTIDEPETTSGDSPERSESTTGSELGEQSEFGESKRARTTPRRNLLRVGATVGLAALAGCNALTDGQDGDGEGPPLDEFRGSGVAGGGRDIDAPRIAELPDLSGKLTLYLGGGEGGLYIDLLDLFEEVYPDFQPTVKSAPSASLANTIIEEKKAGVSPADVFWAVDAGSLGVVAKAGHTLELPGKVVQSVPKTFHPNDLWVGVAGRARAIPYNTETYSAADIPDDVMAFATEPAFENAMGWAPTYSAFQAFLTAMRILEGERRTRRWLRGMLEQNVTEYRDEWFVSNAVADGEVSAGFANHYYALRVKAARTETPIDLAFTKNDAGALINTSGAAIVEGTGRRDLATRFVRHLLSAEAQEFFATRTFAYPMVAGVPPVGGLPRIDELDPPDVPLTELSNLEPTLELMRDVGVL